MSSENSTDMRLVDGLHRHMADAIRQDEMDAPIPDFFVLSHGTKKCGGGIRGQLIREAGLIHEVVDARSDMCASQAKLDGQSRGHDHADGNGLPMPVTAILCDRFQRMAYRMPKVQDAPPIPFSLICSHNDRLAG